MTSYASFNIPGSKHIQASSPSKGLVLLRLNRGPVNAFNEPYWRELHRTFDHLSSHPEVRCIVLSSAFDKLFTAGLDLNDTDTLSGGKDLDVGRKGYILHHHVKDFQDAITSIEKCHKPVIAAINGLCLGLGVDIASACDIRLASESAIFGILEVDVGLAADIGTLQRFPKIVSSASLARELCFTGRRFGAIEAEGMGFVSKVTPGGLRGVEEEAIRMGGVIAGKSPVAVLGTKNILNYSRDHSVDDGLNYTAAWNMAMLQTEDMTRALQNFKNKGKGAVYSDMPEVLAKL